MWEEKTEGSITKVVTSFKSNDSSAELCMYIKRSIARCRRSCSGEFGPESVMYSAIYIDIDIQYNLVIVVVFSAMRCQQYQIQYICTQIEFNIMYNIVSDRDICKQCQRGSDVRLHLRLTPSNCVVHLLNFHNNQYLYKKKKYEVI